MTIVTTIDEARDALDGARSSGRVVGLVPTMGHLHDGHLSLMRASTSECGYTLATIFVNPLQFGEGEDLASYPRDLDRDAALAVGTGADLVLAPPLEEMYPEPMATTVTVSGITDSLEGQYRPTHFAGVATVVAKLFNIAAPCRAYFGEKDYQQLAMVRRMASDLSFPVDVVGCPTVREPDGLAMSSRNDYLDHEQRQAATVLSRALHAGVAAIGAGERDRDAVQRIMVDMFESEPLAALDYAEVADATTLRPIDDLDGDVRLLVAARVGAARLIDNMGVSIP